MRLIDADELLKKTLPKNPDAKFHCVPVEDIKAAPTIEPERKKGRWMHDGYDIPHGIDWIHCSVCGRREPNVPAARTPYCPNCGSDMREEGDS